MARERHAHAPAARELAAGAPLRLLVEAEARQDARRAGGRRMRVDVGQPQLDFRDPMRVGRVFGLGEKACALGIGR